MKRVIWIDEKGWKRASIVKDNAKPEEYPMGLPSNPPDMASIDWQEVAKEINNNLIDRGLFSYADLSKPNSGYEGAVKGVLIKAIICLYKLLEV